ncbi:MAG TPA: heparan-alpha-glucosaminide N-acetyltransferase domain-containing protein [bacterium]|nr:heparan-alpha-glucosaminide N-acetyltransferase domain-containing protein [bacterium]
MTPHAVIDAPPRRPDTLPHRGDETPAAAGPGTRPTVRPEPDTRAAAPRPAGRLPSLDAFRGFVIAGMLLVNNMIWNAATPRQLMHAPWGGGVTFTDMILPWFVFTVGVTVPVGARAGLHGAAYALRVARRTATLVALGILIDSVAAHRLTVGMDVLQLLGLSYLVAALLSRTPVPARLAAAAGLLAAYGALLTLVPAPGLGAGVFQAHHNVIQYLNDAYLTRYALAGVLAVAPASALALLGTIAGGLLRAGRAEEIVKTGALAAAGVALALGGWLWGQTLPLNKDLWTPTYVLFAGGLGLLLLAACHLLFDVVRLRPLGVPFAVFGSNAIVGYVASALFAIGAMQTWPDPLSRGHTLSLHTVVLDPLGGAVGAVAAGWIYTASVIVVWWLALFALYRRRVFIRV